MTSKIKPKFVVLCILDGWGLAPEGPGNAIKLAATPNMDKYWASYPHTQLDASGRAVGLPQGEAGNTETGHMNLGAGRVVYQDLERINMAIREGLFFENETLLSAIKHVKENNSKLHLMGLVGAGGVHSNIEHLFALIKMASENNIKELYIHVFTDGRDSPPTASKNYIREVRKVIDKEGVGQIASVMGRYWSMDRDQRWDRTAKAYFALTKGDGRLVKSVEEAIDMSYDEGKTDEFIEPSLITDESGNPMALIEEGDSCIFFNFRIDRPRQLSKAFVFKNFDNAAISYDLSSFKRDFGKDGVSDKHKGPMVSKTFERGKKIKNLFFVTMTEYGEQLTNEGAKPAFPPQIIDMPISGLISTQGVKQLKITESEKERFVTYYFNGLHEKPYPLEDRIIIPSPKVKTYDLRPEMSSKELTKTLMEKLQLGAYGFIVVNYPNADMVGHTGNIGPTAKAIEAIDDNIGKLGSFVLSYEGVLIVTADHGNAEEMINLKTKEIDTEHSANKVPFIVISKQLMGKSVILPSGKLADVGPTILNLLKISPVSGMTGRDLLEGIDI
jgi:2,3-bisphosphoglycerate-independent phosphoglycerate mutase